ncbi:DUF4153 domain-containing protein [Streptomyces sp. NPDC001970]
MRRSEARDPASGPQPVPGAASEPEPEPGPGAAVVQGPGPDAVRDRIPDQERGQGKQSGPGTAPDRTEERDPGQASPGARASATLASQHPSAPVPQSVPGPVQVSPPWPHPAQPWPPKTPPAKSRLDAIRPGPPAPVRAATLWCALAAALLSALLLGDGLGVNLLIVAVPTALAAFFAAQAAGRRLRPWTAVWALATLGLFAVPALRDAGWPTFLAVVSALAVGSLALHGGRSWPGVVFGSVGLFDSIGSGAAWGWRGLRERADGSRGRWGPVVRTIAVAAALLVVFGALFAGADAAFADLLGELIPDVSFVDGPWRFFLFVVGLVGALAAARTAAAPLRWDRLTLHPGKARGRFEWALPLVVLNLLFAAFNTVQLAVLFGGYDKVLSETGLTYAEYARQGFWQLLWATLLTLVVIGLALRWAPRDGARDRVLVRSVLGTLCVLTLVVVASALRRMDLYVDAYGLTRLRVSVAAMELWLGLVIVLIIAAGLFGGRWLPRAVAGSAAAAVLAFGLASPDALIAERNVQRYEATKKIDVDYLRDLSADAVPALDRLPEPVRSCTLQSIQTRSREDEPWYATSWGEEQARSIFKERPAKLDRTGCPWADGPYGEERDEYDEDAEFGDGGSDEEYDPGTGMD